MVSGPRIWILCAVWFGCARAPVPSAPRVDAKLILELISTRVRSRDDLRAHFVVTNTGTVPLWMNGRMLLAVGPSFTPVNEVWVEVKDRPGLPFWCYLDAPVVEAKHYKVLQPGESGGRFRGGPSADLRCLGLDAPGKYVLVAHYRDGNEPDRIPPTPPGSTYLGWELVAEPVTVEITEGSKTPTATP